MNIVIIQRSKNPSKKFDATINGVKTLSFGATWVPLITQFIRTKKDVTAIFYATKSANSGPTH
jgi:hypothetical protein